jgi:hypothetical protein
VASLAGVPLACYFPIEGLVMTGIGGGVAALGAYGARAEKPYPKIKELTHKDIRELARKMKEEKKHGKEKAA